MNPDLETKDMHNQFMPIIWSLAGILVGGLIGVSFGMLQQAAWRRHQKLERAGQFTSGWGGTPGSIRRVVYLLLALALVQLLFPLLFSDGFQWWVSGGVVAGYGATLYSQLRQRLSETN